MGIWYVNPATGVDTNAGTSWALACKTMALTGKGLAWGDTIRVAATPAPSDTGQTALWQSGTYNSWQWKNGSTLNVSSMTATNPCTVTCSAAHGLATGEYVGISGNSTYANNGMFRITVTSATQFTTPILGVATGASGTIYRLSNQIVTLSSPVSAVISNCDFLWTAGSSTTLTLQNNNNSKYGNGCNTLTMVSPAASTKLAYFAFSATDFSAYNQVSFWIGANSAAIVANNYNICLCSDAAGATVVNTIAIPAVPSTGQWVCFTVDTGAALGASIQSVAIYTGTSPPASSNFRISHIIACLPSSAANSISLTSLVGVNDGVQGWFSIRNIVGTMLVLDTGVSSWFGNGRGYYGTSTTAQLWKRETFKQPMMAAATSTNNSLMSNNFPAGGGAGSPMLYSGGWNPVTNAQDQTGNGANQTFWDGQNGFGSGICAGFAGSTQYVSVANFGLSRFNIAVGGYPGTGFSKWDTCSFNVFNVTNCTNVTASTCANVSMTIANVSFLWGDMALVGGIGTTTNTFAFGNVFAVSGGGFRLSSFPLQTVSANYMVSVANSAVENLSTTSSLNCPLFINCGTALSTVLATILSSSLTVQNGTTGISVSGGNNLVIGSPTVTTAVSGCTTAVALSSSQNTIFRNLSLTGNTTDIALTTNTGANYLVDSTYSSPPTFSGSTDERFYMRNPNGITSAMCYSDNMICQTDLATVHTAGNRSWNIATSRTVSTYPATLNLGYVVIGGNVTNTISAWVYYTTAGMTAGIQVVGNQIEGMTVTQQATSTGTANTWIQVTLTITTATQSGPVMVQAYGLSSTGTQNMWIADITVS